MQPFPIQAPADLGHVVVASAVDDEELPLLLRGSEHGASIRTGITKSLSPCATQTATDDARTRSTVSKCTRDTTRQNVTSPGTTIRRAMSRADVNGDCRISARGGAYAASSAAIADPSECPK